jgi:hypothetical protein
MKAEMQLTILEDGTISIQTGNMAGEHHASADEFIKLVHQLAGGGLHQRASPSVRIPRSYHERALQQQRYRAHLSFLRRWRAIHGFAHHE